MPEFTRTDRENPPTSEADGLIAGVSPAGPAPAPEVTWSSGMLEADAESAARAFDRAIGGLAERLHGSEAARFLMALDALLAARHEASAIAVEESGLHPRHRLTRSHDFFLTRIGAGERVADLGCGTGSLSVEMALQCAARVVGVDTDEAALESARKRVSAADLGHGSMELARGDIMEIAGGGECPALEGTFDVVVMSGVLERLTDRARTLRALMGRLRATRVLIRATAFERDWRVAWKRELGVDWRADPTHEVEHTREELSQDVLAAGLWIESVESRWGEYYMVARAR